MRLALFSCCRHSLKPSYCLAGAGDSLTMAQVDPGRYAIHGHRRNIEGQCDRGAEGRRGFDCCHQLFDRFSRRPHSQRCHSGLAHALVWSGEVILLASSGGRIDRHIHAWPLQIYQLSMRAPRVRPTFRYFFCSIHIRFWPLMIFLDIILVTIVLWCAQKACHNSHQSQLSQSMLRYYF